MMSTTPIPARNPVFLGLFNAIAFVVIGACIVQAFIRWTVDGWFMPALLALAFILATTDWDAGAER